MHQIRVQQQKYGHSKQTTSSATIETRPELMLLLIILYHFFSVVIYFPFLVACVSDSEQIGAHIVVLLIFWLMTFFLLFWQNIFHRNKEIGRYCSTYYHGFPLNFLLKSYTMTMKKNSEVKIRNQLAFRCLSTPLSLHRRLSTLSSIAIF